MANVRHATTPLAGVNIDERTTTDEFALGSTVEGVNNQGFIYVQANGAVATGTCTVDAAFQLTDAAGTFTADVAFVDNEFGWVRQTAGVLA